MVEAVAPTRSRRLPFWAIIIALVISALAGVFVLLWFKLPTWAPEWVVEHSPWVDPIVRAVETDPEQYYPAIAAIAPRGESAAPVLIRHLSNGSLEVRVLVVKLLGELHTTSAFDALVGALGDPDGPVVFAAIEELEEGGYPEAIIPRRSVIAPMLISLLSHPDFSVRMRSIRVIGKLREESAFQLLIERLHDSSPHVIAVAATALGEFSDPRIRPPLVELLDRPRTKEWEEILFSGVYAPVLSALAGLSADHVIEIIEPLPQDYEKGSWRFEIASRLMDTRALVALDEAMRMEEPKEITEWDRNFPGGRAAIAAKGLAESKHPEAQRLIRASLDDPAHLIRARAVLGIAQSYGHGVDQSLLDAVALALDDSAVEVRVAAAFSYPYLSKHLSPKAVEERLIAMTTAPSPKEREHSIYALGSPDVSDKAIQRIIDGTNDADRKVRSAAWAALSKSKSPRFMKAAAEGYPSASVSRRRQLVQVLLTNNTTMDRDKASFITQAASDDDPRVMEAFAKAKVAMGLSDAVILRMAIDQ